jgi:hypothetical protein
MGCLSALEPSRRKGLGDGGPLLRRKGKEQGMGAAEMILLTSESVCFAIFNDQPPLQPIALRNKKSTMRIALRKTCTKPPKNLQILHETRFFSLPALLDPR